MIESNNLSSLPAGTFNGLTSLETLRIDSNRLSSLPAGTFNGLTSLVSVRAQGNTVDPLALTVELEKIGEDGFRARVIQGAPFDIVLPLSIEGGTIDGGATSVTVSKGSIESAMLEVTRTANSTDAVTVDIGTLPGLPTDFDPDRGMTFGRYHQGYTLVKSDALPLTVIRADLTTTVSLGIDPASPVAEGVGTVTVTLTAATNRALAPEADVEVTVATADGTAMAGEDFDSLSETVTFAIADFALVTGGTHYEAAEDVTLTVTDDALDDDDETFSIELSTSEEAADPPTLGPALTVTITDDDDAPGAPATLSAEGGFEGSDAHLDRAGRGRHLHHRRLRLPGERRHDRALRLGPGLDRHPRQRGGRRERNQLHRRDARGRGAGQRHHLHLRGARAKRGRRR